MSRAQSVHAHTRHASPQTIAKLAVESACRSVAFTYNDPVVFYEYAVDTARACHERDIQCVAVTAGYITAEARKSFFRQMEFSCPRSLTSPRVIRQGRLRSQLYQFCISDLLVFLVCTIIGGQAVGNLMMNP